MAHLDDLAAQYDFVETEVIGQSWEGRDLKIIKICKDGCGNKPAIWIDGGSLSPNHLNSCWRLEIFGRNPRQGMDQPGHGAVDSGRGAGGPEDD